MPSHGEPRYVETMILRNSGVIKTEAGTTIISVSAAGVVTVSSSTVTLTDLTTTGNTTLGNAATDTTAINGATTITTISASGLVVGKNGAANPVFQVDASASSIATGVKVTGAAAAGGVSIAAISSGTNESLKIDAKGSGTITIGSVSTGQIQLQQQTVVNGAFTANGPVGAAKGEALPAGGNANASITATTTSNFGVFFGSGAPTVGAAKGSLYLRSDGTTTNDRAYINTDGGTTWTSLTTAA